MLTQRHMGLEYIHTLEVCVSICENCGFILGSPTVELAELNKYYGDMPALFQPESSYSIEKRITILNTISQYNGNEKIKVYYIDGSWNLRLCTQNKELDG